MQNLIQNKQTMSSLEIAELTGKDHSDVLKDIRRILSEAEIGEGEFSSTYLSSQNKVLPCFNLPRRECDLIIAGYSVKYRLAIIDRWQELESQQKPLSHLEVLAQSALALVEMDNRTKALESEVKLLSAKIEKSPTDYFTVAGFASMRGVKVDVRDANKLGRKAARLSKEHDYPIGKAHSEIFGEVNTYHLDILSEVFETIGR